MPRGMSNPKELAEVRTKKALSALHMVQKLASYEILSPDNRKQIVMALYDKMRQIEDSFDNGKVEEVGFKFEQDSNENA